MSVHAPGPTQCAAVVLGVAVGWCRPFLAVDVPLVVQSQVLLNGSVVSQRVPEHSPRPREPDELLLEAPVAQRDASLAFDRFDGVQQLHASVDHHVGDARSGTTVDAHGAVDEGRAAVSLGAVQEVERLVEVPRYVVALVVVRLELVVVDGVAGVG